MVAMPFAPLVRAVIGPMAAPVLSFTVMPTERLAAEALVFSAVPVLAVDDGVSDFDGAGDIAPGVRMGGDGLWAAIRPPNGAATAAVARRARAAVPATWRMGDMGFLIRSGPLPSSTFRLAVAFRHFGS
jgi:hypothetical protein